MMRLCIGYLTLVLLLLVRTLKRSFVIQIDMMISNSTTLIIAKMSHQLAYQTRIYTALHPYFNVYVCVCDAQISEIPNSSTTPHLFKPNRTNSTWMMAPNPLLSLYYCVIVFVYTTRFVVYFVILSINTILTVFLSFFSFGLVFFSLLKIKQTWNES